MSEKNLSTVNEIVKPNFSENETALLERFKASGASDAELVKKIIVFYMDEMKDIMKIDPKGNMGLQALARQEAYKMLSAIAEIIYPDIVEYSTKPEVKAAINPWR